jgi:hypothetical protein
MMGTEGSLVDLTQFSTRRKHENIVDLTAEEEEDIQVVQPNKRQKQAIEIDLNSPPASEKEKRLARYRNEPTKAFQERLKSALAHRISLIQQKPYQLTTLIREYVVIGESGNVYNVTIDNQPKCNCEDNKNGQNRVNCEHIIFVFLRVFKLTPNDSLLYQKALLDSELSALFRNYMLSPAILADPRVVEKYLEITGTERSKRFRKKEVKQKPVDSDCPVCFEKMSSSEDIVYCKYSCGNSIHTNSLKDGRSLNMNQHKK